MEEEGRVLHYINDPEINARTAPELKLYRPKISFVKAGLTALMWIAGTALVSFLISLIFRKTGFLGFSEYSSWQAFIRVYWVAQLLVLLATLRFILIWFVRIYQHYAKSETRLRCVFTPSCSEYAILALKKYGALIGSIKTLDRLSRCGSERGIDYP